MLSTRLTTTGNGILSYKLGNMIQGVQSLIERRTANNKRFGKLELSISQHIGENDNDAAVSAEARNIIAGFLLDTSGSMQGKKLQHAINTIKKFMEVIHSERNGKTIKQQPIRAWIYVITFNSVAELVVPFQEITDETIPLISEHLDHVRADGCTNYQRAFIKQTEVIEDIIKKLSDRHHDNDPEQESVEGGQNPQSSVEGGRNPQRNPQHYHWMRFFETDGEITEGSTDVKKLYKMMRSTSAATTTATAAAAATGPRFTFEDYVVGYGTGVDLGCLKDLASPYPPAESVAGGRNPQQESVAGGRNPPHCSTLTTILNDEDIGFKAGEILFKLIMRCGNNWNISVETSGGATVELFEYQTHQWGTETSVHSMIYGEKKTLWVQYTPAADTLDTPATPTTLPPVQVKIQYENQFTAEKFTYQFEHEIASEQQEQSETEDAATAAAVSIGDLVTPLFPLILGMSQIEIFKMFREMEADRYDKDIIVREAYKILRILKSIDEIARISHPAIACQTLNLITDVKVIIGLTTIEDKKEQRMVIHDRRICSAEEEVFNSGAKVSRKYVPDEEEHEEDAIRVINAAKKAALAAAAAAVAAAEAAANPEANPDDKQQPQPQPQPQQPEYDEYEEVNDGLPSRIPTMMPDTQDYMDTPFVGGAGRGGRHGSYNGNRRTHNGSEVRALCVRIATARNKQEDTSAEELYQQMQAQQQQYGGNGGWYEPDDDAPCYHGGRDDTFSSTPMDDDYTQRRIGIMRQMSS
jgi:hypothetical protein